MQNVNNTSYINKNKIINIKSEVLFREAEDDLFYFNKINSAFKQLKTALELTPYHYKSIVMYADICFMKGYIKKALKFDLSKIQNKSLQNKFFCSIKNRQYTSTFKNKRKTARILAVENLKSASILSGKIIKFMV